MPLNKNINNIRKKKTNRFNTAPVNDYAKNVFKSIAMASKENVKKIMPDTSEFVQGNSELFKEIYSNLRTFKTTLKRSSDVIDRTPIMKISSEWLENAKQDLKTGQFLSDRRMQDMSDQMDNFFTEDPDQLYGTDEEDDFSDQDTGDTGKDTNRMISANASNTNNIVGSVGELARSNLAGTEYLAENQKALNNLNLVTFTRKADESNFHLSNISSRVGGILDFYNTNMNAYFETSYNFYEQMLEIQRGTYNVVKSQYDLLYNSDNNTSSYSSREQDIFMSSGGLNIGEYGKFVKSNIKEFISTSSGGIGDIIEELFADGEVKPDWVLSPLGFIPSAMVNKIIPDVLKKSMTSFDKTFSNFFKSLLMKISRGKDDGGIAGIIASIFGLKNEKESVNLGNYKKGPTPFDGVTRKAIIEVIPTYLRKILSALTGKAESVYNYDTAKYERLDIAKGKYRDTINSMYDISIYDTKSKIFDKIEKTYKFDNKKNKDILYSDISEIFRHLVERGYMFHPDKDIDQIDMGPMDLKNPSSYDAFLGAFRSLSRQDQMAFNSQSIDALHSRNDTVRDIMQKMELTGISNAMAGWDDEYYNTDKNIKKVNRVGLSEDKFGETTHSYLRKLLELLYKGIVVYPNSMYVTSGGSGFPDHIKAGWKGLKLPEIKEKSAKRKDNMADIADRERYRTRAAELSERDITRLIYSIGDMGDSYKDIEKEINIMTDANDTFNKNRTSSPKRYKYKISESIHNLINAPSKILANVFDRLDYTMYRIIYGDSIKRDEKGKITDGVDVNFSFITKIFSNISEFVRLKILDPLDDKLFNEKDGIITKIKDSLGGLWEDFKGNLSGEKGFLGLGEDFSLRTQGKSIFNKIKIGLHQILFGTKDQMNVDKDGNIIEAKGKQGILSGLQDRFYELFYNFSTTLFGGKRGSGYNRKYEDKREGGEEKFNKFKLDLTTKLKERFPSMAIDGTVGLIGSFFLPGGPILGTLLGASFGFARHSDTIKDFLFGKVIDEETGLRSGNKVFSSSFMKKYKEVLEPMLPGIKKGIGIGGVSSLLLGFGPISGILLGGAISWAKQSESFKRFLFGDDDKEGLFNKDIKEKLKRYAPSIGKGAGLGMVGGLVTGLGPIFGILAGSSIGFASELDIVKDRLFGPMKDGKRQGGGWVDQIKDTMSEKVWEPFKKAIFGSKENPDKKGIIGNIKDWFKESINDPFKAALKPFTEEMKIAGRNIADIFRKAFEGVFEEAVGKPIGKLLEEKFIDPMKKFLGKLVGGLGRFIGKILSAPIKAFASFSGGLAKNHLRSGAEDGKGNRVSSYLDNLTDEQLNILNLSREMIDGYNKGDKVSLFDKIKTMSSPIMEKSRKKMKEQTDKMQNSVSSFLDGLFKKKENDGIPFFEKFRIFMGASNSMLGNKFNKFWVGMSGKLPKFFREKYPNRAKSKSSTSVNITSTESVAKDIVEDNKTVSNIVSNADTNVDNTSKATKNNSNISSSSDNVVSILRNIEKHTGITSNEVKGQLDGVGYNIEKIKNILVNGFGDADATGIKTSRGNKKRKGLFGAITEFIKRPFTFLKNVVGSSIKTVGSFIKDMFQPIMDVVGTVANAILSIPNFILKVLRDTFSLVTSTAKVAFEGVVGIVKQAGNLVLSTLEGFGYIVAGIGEGIGTAFSSLGDVVKFTISSFTKLATEAIPKLIGGIGSLFSVIGKGVKWLGGGIASLLGKGKRGKDGKDRAPDIYTVNRVKVLDKIKDTINVSIVGGHLDSIGSIGKVSPASNISDDIENNSNVTGVRKDASFIRNIINKRREEKLRKDAAEDIDNIAIHTKQTAEDIKNSLGKEGFFGKLFKGFKGNAGFADISALWAAITAALPAIIGLINLSPMIVGMFKNIGSAHIDSDGDGIFDGDKNKDGKVTLFESMGHSYDIYRTEDNPRGAKRAEAKLTRNGLRLLVAFPEKHPKITAACTKIFKKLFEWVAKRFPKFSSKLTRVADDLAGFVCKRLTKEGAEKIVKISLGPLLEIGFFVFDAFTGTIDTRNILKLPSDAEVTWNMRIACGSSKALSGLIMDLPSLIGISWGDIAMFIYKSMGTDEEIQQIEEAQNRLKSIYDAAVANDEFDGSFEDYNDRLNKTLWDKGKTLWDKGMETTLPDRTKEIAANVNAIRYINANREGSTFSKFKEDSSKAFSTMSDGISKIFKDDTGTGVIGNYIDTLTTASKVDRGTITAGDIISLPSKMATGQTLFDSIGSLIYLLKNKKGKGGSVARLSLRGNGESIVNGIPYYSQKDGKWAEDQYSNQTMKSMGCAPSAVAMVISSLTGQSVTPKDTAMFAANGMYSDDDGTNFTYISDVLKYYGIDSQLHLAPINSNIIKGALNKGQLVILLGTDSSEPFTADGHYVVATSMKGSKVYINDPISKERSKDYNISKIVRKTEAIWIINRASRSGNAGIDAGNMIQMLVGKMLEKSIGVNPFGGMTGYRTGGNIIPAPPEESLIPQINMGTVPIEHGASYKNGNFTYTNLKAPGLVGALTAGTKELLISRLSRLATDNNNTIDIASSYRSIAHQQDLYNRYMQGTGNQAAKPGSSAHNFGLAIDVNSDWVKKLTDNELRSYGLWKPVKGENWHIEPIETKGNRNVEKYPNVVLSGAGKKSSSKSSVRRVQDRPYNTLAGNGMESSSTSGYGANKTDNIFFEILSVLKNIAENTKESLDNKVTIVVDKKESVTHPKSAGQYNNSFLNIVEQGKRSVQVDYENAITIAAGVY